jgi:hypothetical protein
MANGVARDLARYGASEEAAHGHVGGELEADAHAICARGAAGEGRTPVGGEEGEGVRGEGGAELEPRRPRDAPSGLRIEEGGHLSGEGQREPSRRGVPECAGAGGEACGDVRASGREEGAGVGAQP